ncbi:hypothetical protein [Granulicella tundricola]|uniref:Uncharacterized protein n=1 Tax=Granulicella tundricola (strain ATCC BAA-1859 / DSM 23138 / MP5ACTX9) TaxID=1198114 RepID=E8WXD3_GRATM|nr:hypothetical protein [Granulicella tundricola]ADW67466.1 hypothetical protein AciX9_0394 [Granulicella tundricola MP5ACTX9]
MDAFERFPIVELTDLRDELRSAGLDSWQAGELLTAFLAARGYGVSNDEARGAASRLEARGCSVPHIQRELESLAFVM